ncbi:hypothetical protein LINPERPRIM_LOCUS25779 [Linum perenne]
MTEKESSTGAGGDGSVVSLDLLKNKMDEFAKERDWERFHSPRNLLLAMKQAEPALQPGGGQSRRSRSIRKLHRYASRRAKLAVRSFRLGLATIYEGTAV